MNEFTQILAPGRQLERPAACGVWTRIIDRLSSDQDRRSLLVEHPTHHSAEINATRARCGKLFICLLLEFAPFLYQVLLTVIRVS